MCIRVCLIVLTNCPGFRFIHFHHRLETPTGGPYFFKYFFKKQTDWSPRVEKLWNYKNRVENVLLFTWVIYKGTIFKFIYNKLIGLGAGDNNIYKYKW